jgi:tellurite methyltransferase
MKGKILMFDMEKIGAYIASKRRDSGLTQGQFAEKLNVTHQAVSKWETGQSCPDISLLPDLAFALDTDINSLMGYIYNKKRTTIYEDEYKQDGFYWGIRPSYLCNEYWKWRRP